VLKLSYHTTVFGQIDFEYDRPVIRVGRSSDNDLILDHPSIEPHHCLLVFCNEKVRCMPPNQTIHSQTDLQNYSGAEFGIGDTLRIGELEFKLAHSSRTVDVPMIHKDSPAVDAVGTQVALENALYYCTHCRAFIKNADVKRLGLLGHPKREFCPKCSRSLQSTQASLPETAPSLKHKGLSSMIKSYGSRLLGGKDS
jgi:hypothetical protein